MKFIKYLFLIFGLNSVLAFSQYDSKLLLQNKKGKTIYHLTEGSKVRIVDIDKYQMSKKYIGTLKIINDSIIMVNEKLIHIDSIYKMGQLSKSNYTLGYRVSGIGSVCLVMGVATMINSSKIENPFTAIMSAAVGTAMFIIGTAMTIEGGRIANGKPRIVKSDRKIIIQKCPS